MLKYFKKFFVKKDTDEKEMDDIIIDEDIICYINKLFLSCNENVYQKQTSLNFLNHILNKQNLSLSTKEHLESLKTIKEYEIKKYLNYLDIVDNK